MPDTKLSNSVVAANTSRVSRLTSRMTLSDDEIAKAVYEVVIVKGVLTVGEVADIIHKSDRHAYRYLEGEVPFKVSQFIAIAQVAFERGDRSLIDLILPTGHILTSLEDSALNGTVADEALAGLHALSDGEKSCEAGELDKSDAAFEKLEKISRRARGEIKAKRSKGGKR